MHSGMFDLCTQMFYCVLWLYSMPIMKPHAEGEFAERLTAAVELLMPGKNQAVPKCQFVSENCRRSD